MTSFGPYFRFGVLALTLSFGAAGKARAEDVIWNGFFSTGTAFSNKSTTYQHDITKQPDVVGETILGLNLAREISPTVRLAAQFLARENDADSAVKADWAFMTFNPTDDLQIVVGKQKMPMWMMSQYIDVGALYPWARPPEEVYSLFNLKSFTGASIAYDFRIGPSTLTIAPYGGETQIEGAPNAPTANSKIKGTNLFGAELQLRWNQTTLHAGFNRAKWDLDFGDEFRLGQRRFNIWSYGISTRYAGLLLMAEYAETRDLSSGKFQKLADDVDAEAAAAAAGGNGADAAKLQAQALLYRYRLGGHKAYYITTGYHPHSAGMYLTYANLKKDVISGFSNSQRSLALGLNYDVTDQSVIKVEAKQLRITGDSVGLFQAQPGTPASGLDKAMIYSLTYNLIF